MANGKKTKYLITGGAGAIGSSLVNHLSEDSNNVIDVIDNLYSGYERNITPRKNVTLHIGSISNTEYIENYKKDYDYIFHLAAFFANQNSVEDPLLDMEVNIKGTINLLELAKQQKNLKKFVYTSSSCIYGNSERPMKETDFPQPDTPYAVSKLSGEHYTNYFTTHYKIPTNTVRLFNIYGSNEYPGIYRNVIPNFVHKAINGQDIPVMGKGLDERDFTHISDAIEMLFGISEDKTNSGEIFNIGSGTALTIIELAETILRALNSKSSIKFVPKRDWDTVNKRKAHVGKVQKYKKGSHKKIHVGLTHVYDFIADIQEHIEHDRM